MCLASHTGQLLNWLSYFDVFLSHNQARPTIISPPGHDRSLPHPSQLTFHKLGDFWHCIVIVKYIDTIVMYYVKELRDVVIMPGFSSPCSLRNYRLPPRVAENFASLRYYAANSRIITRRVITVKNPVLSLYNAVISISPLCRHYQWQQYKQFATRNNPEAKVRGKYIKRIIFFTAIEVPITGTSQSTCHAQRLRMDLYQQHYGLIFSHSSAQFQIIVRHKRNLLQNIDINEQEQHIWFQLSNGKI